PAGGQERMSSREAGGLAAFDECLCFRDEEVQRGRLAVWGRKSISTPRVMAARTPMDPGTATIPMWMGLWKSGRKRSTQPRVRATAVDTPPILDTQSKKRRAAGRVTSKSRLRRSMLKKISTTARNEIRLTISLDGIGLMPASLGTGPLRGSGAKRSRSAGRTGWGSRQARSRRTLRRSGNVLPPPEAGAKSAGTTGGPLPSRTWSTRHLPRGLVKPARPSKMWHAPEPDGTGRRPPDRHAL